MYFSSHVNQEDFKTLLKIDNLDHFNINLVQ